METPNVPYRLVLIQWEDSARPISQWQWVDDYQIPGTVQCVSVGYLIAETKKAVALAPTWGTSSTTASKQAGSSVYPAGPS
jgi:hypothetical protein